MCRLFALVDGTPDKFSDLMVPFRALSSEHAHGWGVAWYDGSGLRLERSPLKASDDPRFLEASAMAEGRIIMSHIRKSTRGTRTVENTHPFPFGRWVFGHNGTIEGYARILDGLPPEYRARLKGRTDSEMLFQWLLWHMESRGDEVEGLRDGIAAVRPLLAKGTTAINFTLSDGQRLYAYRESLTRHGIYDLRYLDGDGGLAVCSEPLGSGEWAAVDNGELLIASPGGRAEKLDLFGLAPVAEGQSLKK